MVGYVASFPMPTGSANWNLPYNAALAQLDIDIPALYAFVNSSAATSETSLSVATGSKAFTIDQAGFTATAGATYKATSTGAPTAVMVGTVTSFTGGVLTLNVQNVGGSGTHADWQITPVLASASATAEVDVASATTTDLGAATSDNVRITGTTTITGLGTALAGVRRYVRFQGALSLTYNASSLILKGAATRTTAANDSSLFVSLGSGNWIELLANKADGTSITTAPVLPVTARTSNTIIAAADIGKAFKITSGTFTQTWDTGANLGATFSCFYENAGTGIVTTVTDGVTWALYPGEARLFYSDGSNVKSICLRAGTLSDTASGNLIVAPGWNGWEQDLSGGAGGGGGGLHAAASTGVAHHGGLGGGGASRRIRKVLLANTSHVAGDTIAYTIGAAGTHGTGGTSPTAGGNGGNTTFNGDTAYGGGGGAAGETGSSALGGGGASINAAANLATGGAPAASNATAIAGQGTTPTGSSLGAEWGGASSGNFDQTGGSAIYGGAAGGVGGYFSSSDTPTDARDGGTQGSMTNGGGAAHGAAGANGSDGATGATGLGQGGGGGGYGSGSTNAGNGGKGSPGCGGGGGGAQVGTGAAGDGGDGGGGKIKIGGF